MAPLESDCIDEKCRRSSAERWNLRWTPEGRSDHPDPKQARPQTTQTSHPDHPDRPDQTTQTAQTKTQTKTQTARAARRTRQGQPDRGRPGRRGFIETAQFPLRCEIETGYYPIETDLNDRSNQIIAMAPSNQVKLAFGNGRWNCAIGSTVKVTAA